jgi:hypothetical protein
VSRPSALAWRGQFEEDGLVGFGEVAKGRGRKPSISDEKVSERRCCVDRIPAGSAVAVVRLAGERELCEGRWKPALRVEIHAELVVASAEVLDERPVQIHPVPCQNSSHMW